MPEEKVEQQWPDVIAMVVADGVHQDPATGKFFILGTYSAIGALGFPCRHGPLIVYMTLTDGRGETPLKMCLVDVDEEREPVFEDETTVNFSDPTQVLEIVFMHPQVTFPEPGEYRLKLFGAGEFLRERRLVVFPVPQQPTEPDGGPDDGS
jgi:hypothetical protein